MGKAILAIVVVIGIIGAILVFKNKSALAPSLVESMSASVSPNASVIPSSSSSPMSKSFIVTFVNGAVDINMLTIKVGDTVKFINNDNIPHWPASGPHPMHTACPGFDALRGLTNGESYSFTFNNVEICPFHDHLNTSIHGQITVIQ